jgi:hypothetical protein
MRQAEPKVRADALNHVKPPQSAPRRLCGAPHRIVAGGGIARQVHAFVIVQHLSVVAEVKIITRLDETSGEEVGSR